jgi:hypothetical protein
MVSPSLGERGEVSFGSPACSKASLPKRSSKPGRTRPRTGYAGARPIRPLAFVRLAAGTGGQVANTPRRVRIGDVGQRHPFRTRCPAPRGGVGARGAVARPAVMGQPGPKELLEVVALVAGDADDIGLEPCRPAVRSSDRVRTAQNSSSAGGRRLTSQPAGQPVRRDEPAERRVRWRLVLHDAAHPDSPGSRDAPFGASPPFVKKHLVATAPRLPIDHPFGDFAVKFTISGVDDETLEAESCQTTAPAPTRLDRRATSNGLPAGRWRGHPLRSINLAPPAAATVAPGCYSVSL